MIIPIRCFTCGKVLANKWEYYQKKVSDMQEKTKTQHLDIKERDPMIYFIDTRKKEVLDQIGLTRMCCRRHMLGHVDLVDKI